MSGEKGESLRVRGYRENEEKKVEARIQPYHCKHA